MTRTIKVDIWSDIACPFCYMGKRKFEAGAAEAGAEVEVEYHAYELSPDTPIGYHGSHAEKLADKMGIAVDQARAMEQQIAATARSVGLEFDYERMRPTRTLAAHRLLHHAKVHGVQVQMKERLLAAYFSEGRHVGEIQELADLAAEVGLDRDEVVRMLERGDYAEDVQADIDEARRLGIRGVPFFVVDGRFGLSGAQDPQVFAQVIARALAEQPPVA